MDDTPGTDPAKTDAAETRVLQVRRIGNSLGLILPKDLLAELGLKEGDKLHVVEQTDRGVKLTPFDPKHARVMAIAREVMDEYKDTFRALAK